MLPDQDKGIRESRTSPPIVGLLSVIVPHLNDYENLGICLNLLEKQSFTGPMEIVVADNGSALGVDFVRQIVRCRGRVIEVAERGAATARNAGVREAQGDAIAFIDSDCRPDRRWLEEGLYELRFADIVGGRVNVVVQDPKHMTPAEAFERVFAFRNDRYIQDLRFTVTASMFTWRSVFDAVGGFENGVPEDLNWCRRARLKGYRIKFAPKSIVDHPARRTMPELRSKWRRLTIEWCEQARREGKGQRRVLLRHWIVLLSIGPHALGIMATRRVSGLRNRFLAIGALVQIRLYRFIVAHQIALRALRQVSMTKQKGNCKTI
jgi:GT2 family glycosyltransferase